MTAYNTTSRHNITKLLRAINFASCAISVFESFELYKI